MVDAIAKLRLNTLQCSVKLGGSRRAALDLVQCFMENLGDIEQTNDIALFVAYGLESYN